MNVFNYSVSDIQTTGGNDTNDLFSYTPSATERYAEKSSVDIINALKSTVDEVGGNVAAIRYPHVSEIPLNEYNTQRLFADAYPWLFPGGLGDISQCHNSDNSLWEWSNLLHRWKDGRFMKDDFFSLHVQNFIQRKVNDRFSLVFKNRILSKGNITVEEIQDQIRRGDFSFIEKLMIHGGSKIKGSDSWWRFRKHEIESWISTNIKRGLGPPMLFLTLSCAEYWWSDLISLLKERLRESEDYQLVLKMEETDDRAIRCDLIDKYAAVVQEFFQIKVDNWMETVGRDVFGITSYFLRFEFTKGRGQIHAHILACTKDHVLILPFGTLWKTNKADAVKMISAYARDRLNLSCEIPSCRAERIVTRDEQKQCLQRNYSDVHDLDCDKFDLAMSCHMHECNSYCLRHNKGKGYVFHTRFAF
jgi:hypothetical protein